VLATSSGGCTGDAQWARRGRAGGAQGARRGRAGGAQGARSAKECTSYNELGLWGVCVDHILHIPKGWLVQMDLR